ncbi:MAG: hypothetical protein C4527_26690 [Candidatus Omnitrophota bacterium]|jgi:hypothetical protein|nr:MAG: hypothetical protein C4527_26690 [Candidatus Omnitrophota bacterium]
MTTAEKIHQKVNQLPIFFQEQVLDFVEVLVNKTELEKGRQEELEWSKISISSLFNEIENDEEQEYDESDLIEKWL